VHGVGDVSYVLTQKAFDLLDAPIFASVFISYRRSISSAFALLLHDRLRTEGFDPFIDLQSINPGEKWEDRLRREIGEVDAFVSVMSTGTLESSNVRNEIIWALEREGQEGNFPVIPVWHGGYDPAKDITIYPKLASFLNENNAIIVAKEDVLSYDNAVRQLIQFLKTRP
jgi:hypothetical protein